MKGPKEEERFAGRRWKTSNTEQGRELGNAYYVEDVINRINYLNSIGWRGRDLMWNETQTPSPYSQR